MFDRIASWPRIIAALVAGVGLSCLFSTWSLVFDSPLFSSILFDWKVMIASAILFVLSYLLATGREWARRVLLWAVILIGGSYALWRGVQLFPKSFSDLSPEQMKVIRLGTFLSDLSWFLLIFTLLIFFVLFLSHPAVVASFRPRSGFPEEPSQT